MANHFVKESFWKPNKQLDDPVPPPPPLPKYDPNEEAPMWSWTRDRWGLPVQIEKPWTRIGNRPESDDDPDWRGVIRSKVQEYPMPEPYNVERDLIDRPTYYFFDTPDYADPFKKLFWASKFFFKTGAAAGLLAGICYGKPTSLGSFMWMANKYLIPWWASGMAGTITVITVAIFRDKKDDYYNYAAGGAVAGMVMGRKACLHWIRSTFVLVPLALSFKMINERNLNILPMKNMHKKNLGLRGNTADQGFWSGDLRFGLRARNYGDPGRDVRRTW